MISFLNRSYSNSMDVVGPFYESMLLMFPFVRRSKLLLRAGTPLWEAVCWLLKKTPFNIMIIRKKA